MLSESADPVCGDPEHHHTGPCRVYAHLPQPDPDQQQFIVSWDMLLTQVGMMASKVRHLHGLGGDVVGLHPLPGAEVVTAAVAAASGQPVVSWVGSGVVLVGLVARRCEAPQRWVDQLGEGLAGILWAFRAPGAPAALVAPTFDGMGAAPTFPVNGMEVAGADWLVMPWEADRPTVVGP